MYPNHPMLARDDQEWQDAMSEARHATLDELMDEYLYDLYGGGMDTVNPDRLPTEE